MKRMMMMAGGVALLPVAAAAQPQEGWYHMHDYGWGMGIGMGLGWLVLLALIVGLVVLVTRGGSWPGPQAPAEDHRKEALSILASRYARGEIDSKEYEERKRLLES